jgi:hypothetical protein
VEVEEEDITHKVAIMEMVLLVADFMEKEHTLVVVVVKLVVVVVDIVLRVAENYMEDILEAILLG